MRVSYVGAREESRLRIFFFSLYFILFYFIFLLWIFLSFSREHSGLLFSSDPARQRALEGGWRKSLVLSLVTHADVRDGRSLCGGIVACEIRPEDISQTPWTLSIILRTPGDSLMIIGIHHH